LGRTYCIQTCKVRFAGIFSQKIVGVGDFFGDSSC
jgi:hypothetical protein